MALGSLMRLGVGGVGDYSGKVLSYNPIAYWPLWEAAGGAAEELVSGWDGAYTGVTLGQPGIGDGQTCPLFDGANDFVNIYSVALAAAFDGAEGSLMVWFKAFNAGMWSDGNTRASMNLEADVGNRVRPFSNGAGLLKFLRSGGGVTENVELEAGVADTIWRCGVLVWSETGDYVRGYINGALEGSSNTLGNWAGNLNANMTIIGARTTGPIQAWYGYIAHSAIWDRPLAPAEIPPLAAV